MPRYYFRLQNGAVTPDQDGEILSDDKAARQVAVEVFAQTVHTAQDHLCDGGAYEVVVSRDGDGPVFSVTAQGRVL